MAAYENLFWGMATLVVVAIVGGALFAKARRLGATLWACAGMGLLAGAAVLLLCAEGPFAEQAGILAVAALLFSVVIGTAAALAMRRLLHRQP